MAAISYDSPEILKDFADRHKIEFPLLADPQSKIIASYGVLNPEATGMTKGMALPGYFYIDANGIIREKYFEAKYTDRFTANNVMGEAISGAWRRGQPKSRGPASRHRARPIGSRCRSRQPLRPGGADRASTGCSRLRTRRQRLQTDSTRNCAFARPRTHSSCLSSFKGSLSRCDKGAGPRLRRKIPHYI